MMLSFWRVSGVLITAALWVGPVSASEQEYYRGKTVHIIVGLSAGGGFDI
jgi:tripartite-type tricarboxylate transporter receptor subunit TctC